MTPLRVAVATVRRPKVEGAKAAFESARAACVGPGRAIEWITAEVPSGVDETPTRLEDLLQGARARARALRGQLEAQGLSADFYVGLEGGLWASADAVFLQSWACVSDGTREAFGASGAVAVPSALAHAVVRQGRSLAEAIDALAGERDVRSGRGAWGVLTGGRTTRERSFEEAVANALAPFAQPEVYARRLEPPRTEA